MRYGTVLRFLAVRPEDVEVVMLLGQINGFDPMNTHAVILKEADDQAYENGEIVELGSALNTWEVMEE